MADDDLRALVELQLKSIAELTSISRQLAQAAIANQPPAPPPPAPPPPADPAAAIRTDLATAAGRVKDAQEKIGKCIAEDVADARLATAAQTLIQAATDLTNIDGQIARLTNDADKTELMAQSRVLRDTKEQLISDLRVIIGELSDAVRTPLGGDAHFRTLGYIT